MPLIPKTDPPYYTEGENQIKVYTALLSQSGTNAPVATVLQNTLGNTVVWTYIGVGQYHATLTGAFTEGKTICLSEYNSDYGASFGLMTLGYSNSNYCVLYVNDASGTYMKLYSEYCTVEIRVYP